MSRDQVCGRHISHNSCIQHPDEIDNVENWAVNRNLKRNCTKSVEIVFVRPRSRRDVLILPPVVPDFVRVKSIKALAVTASRKFSVLQHVSNYSLHAHSTLFALCTLHREIHGLSTEAVFLL